MSWGHTWHLYRVSNTEDIGGIGVVMGVFGYFILGGEGIPVYFVWKLHLGDSELAARIRTIGIISKGLDLCELILAIG